MQAINKRTEIAQRKFVMEEERSFFTRAHADVVVGLWAAGKLGMNADEAKTYAASIMEAGVSSAGGRGGFEQLVADLAPLHIDTDLLRGRYAQAMATYQTGTA